MPPKTLAVIGWAFVDCVLERPEILADNSTPRNLDWVPLAVKPVPISGVSVTVHITVYSPTRCGEKVGVAEVVLLNSLVLVVPSGLTEDQLKLYGISPPSTLEERSCGAKLDVAARPLTVTFKSPAVVPISADDVAVTIAAAESVTFTLTTFNPFCATVKLQLWAVVDENSDVETELSGLTTDHENEYVSLPPATLAVNAWAAIEDVEVNPTKLADKSVPITFDCAELAVNVVVELSVTVQVTEYKPVAAGVNKVVEPLVVLNSLVLSEPSGCTAVHA